MNKLNRQSLIYTLSAVFLWSTVATAFKISLEGMNFVQLLFYASVTSTLSFGFFILKEKKRIVLLDFKIIFLGFLNPFFYYIILFNAYTLLPAQEAQPLNYTWPIVLSLFSVLFLKEKMNLKKIVGLLSAFVGVIVIATHGNIFEVKFVNLFGVILAVSTSVIWATYWIVNLKDVRSSIVKLFGAFFWGALFSGIYLFLFDSFKLENYKYLWGASFVGLFEMGITFLLWNKGLELSNDKANTSTLAYLAPFLSVIFIAFVLGETILPSSIIGLAFIVGGILYQNFGK
jgi:drug/metabolite transporter (DMT)-like permease